MSDSKFWYHFDEMFKHMPSLFDKITGKTVKATMTVTDNGTKRTFAISGQMNSRMIQMVREQMDSLELKAERIIK